MVSSYLDQPLRTLEQARDDRSRRHATVGPADPDMTNPGSVDLVVRSPREPADRDGARRILPPDRRHAA